MWTWILAASLSTSRPTWSMMIGGDIMLNGVAANRQPFLGVEKAFHEADVAYANLEIPLTKATTRTPHKSAAAIAARDQYVLKADPKHISGLKKTGFDLLSLANNHAMDYGVNGLKEMRGLLSAAGIKHNGAGGNRSDAERPAVFRTSSGIRVAMVSFLAFKSWGGLSACGPATDTKPGIAVLRFNGVVDQAARQRVAKIVQNAKAQSDFVFVALHWGLEKQTVPTAYQVALGRSFIDAGADLVVGAHPHVLQGAELYDGRPILYSMGNLVSPRGGSTGLIELTFEGNSLKKSRFLPASISSGRVSLASSKTATDRFIQLGKAVQRSYRNSKSQELALSR